MNEKERRKAEEKELIPWCGAQVSGWNCKMVFPVTLLRLKLMPQFPPWTTNSIIRPRSSHYAWATLILKLITCQTDLWQDALRPREKDKEGRWGSVCLFCIFRAIPTAYGGSQPRGWIGAVAAGLCQSHSNSGSEPCLQHTPQLTATLDPQPTEQRQGSNPQPHRS